MKIILGYANKALKRVHGALGEILKKLTSPILSHVVSLKPDGPIRGHVLLSYRIELFLQRLGHPVTGYHQNWLITQKIAKVFLDFGYAVDVIANENKEFLPKKDYAFFIDTRMNFERLAPLLNENCVKILHVTTAHPYFHNAAEASRLMALQERRHVTLPSQRFMPPHFAMAVEYADCVTVPSKFCMHNFRYANKPLYLVPSAAEFVYPWMETKNFESCRTKFIWLGSHGMVHKGLDVVLEAFLDMPEFHLTVCGPVAAEKDFERVYNQELYHTPNIHTLGWIDISSPEFINLAVECVGLVYPSCSEGSAGSVKSCMHAGLIPIISYESGVDIGKDIGVILNDCSISEVKEAVHGIARLSAHDLKQMSRKAWELARANHTMESFENTYRKMVEQLMAEYHK